MKARSADLVVVCLEDGVCGGGEAREWRVAKLQGLTVSSAMRQFDELVEDFGKVIAWAVVWSSARRVKRRVLREFRGRWYGAWSRDSRSGQLVGVRGGEGV